MGFRVQDVGFRVCRVYGVQELGLIGTMEKTMETTIVY